MEIPQGASKREGGKRSGGTGPKTSNRDTEGNTGRNGSSNGSRETRGTGKTTTGRPPTDSKYPNRNVKHRRRTREPIGVSMRDNGVTKC